MPNPPRKRRSNRAAAPAWARAARAAWRAMVVGTLISAAAPRTFAAEPVLEFLHAAQQQGYGEAALDYLEQLRATNRLPAELKETWDLELSRSYRAAVAEAYNAAEAETRLAKAQSHLDQFLKQHPDHPEVARAMESWGDLGLDRALEQLRLAAGLKDPAVKAKHLAAARAALEEARPRFTDATKRYHERFLALKAAASETDKPRPRSTAQMTRKQRAAADALRDAELSWLDCNFKSAKIDFYLGQTYPDPAAPERKPAFEAAAKAFDGVFQSYRESLVGLHAHLWHGRSADEMGNDVLALDIYDEVLATAPEGRERETGLEPLFAQAQYQRLLIVLRKDGYQEFLKQANEWLQLRRVWKKYDAYQGVALAVAKTQLEHAEEIAGNKRGQLIQSSLAMLADIARTRGEFQQQAILLRRQHSQASPQDLSTVKTLDEGLALAESAAASLDWPSAVAALERALELKATTQDAKRVADAQARLEQARYQLAAAHYSAGKHAECLAALRPIIAVDPPSAVAPQASSLAISSALALYAQSTDKPAALAELEQLARQTSERWPDRPEADDARIALGQAALVRGEAAAALQQFEAVNSRSERYPAAMFFAGQTHWRLYLGNKSKNPAAAEQSADRAKAVEQIRLSLVGQQKSAEGGAGMNRQLLETQLLLGEMLADAAQPGEALPHLEPLITWIQSQKPESLDNTQLRVFLATAKTQAALGQLDKAVATGQALAALSGDVAQTNSVLIAILKSVADAWQQAEAEVIEAGTSADVARQQAARAAADQRKQLAAQLLELAAPRKQLALPARIFLADTSAALNQTDRARDLYQAILAEADADPAFKQANAPALTRIQSQLVGLLRQKGDYAGALAQVDQLIAAFPNALEPKMERGRILQAWADTDPARFGDAVAHWTMLRTRLSRAQRKPPEYYEVIYNAATCLFTEAFKSNSPDKARQAEQLLSATLVLSPKLNGPEMVARYKDLLHRTRQLQGGK